MTVKTPKNVIPALYSILRGVSYNNFIGYMPINTDLANIDIEYIGIQ